MLSPKTAAEALNDEITQQFFFKLTKKVTNLSLKSLIGVGNKYG